MNSAESYTWRLFPLLSIVLLTTLSTAALAVVVDFPDPGLEAAIRDEIGKPTGDIYDSDLVALIDLNASNRSISDLSGLEYCTSLESLNVRDNQISDLSALLDLTSLTDLNVLTNQISDIGPLVANVGLGEGDIVNLNSNSLDVLTPGSQANQDIQALRDRGVTVHIMEITEGPSGTPNPVVSGAQVRSHVVAQDSYSEHLDFLWSIEGIEGTFSDVRTPIWTAPENTTDQVVEYVISVTVTGKRFGYPPHTSITASYVQEVTPPQAVEFPDPNLEAAIRTAIGKPSGDIYPPELLGLASLSASRAGISDLTGLEYCTRLWNLRLEMNQITDISPLSRLWILGKLFLGDNQISDISALSGLTKLGDLGLTLNHISDISALSGLTDLRYLGLGYNEVTDISALSGLTMLFQLYLNDNQITDISPLAGLNPHYLYLQNNQVSDISPLAGLSHLNTLYLYGNQISDISAVSGLAKLEYLLLHDNQITDISALAGLAGPTGLSVYEAQMNAILPQSGPTDLMVLSVASNQISDVSAVEGLIYLGDDPTYPTDLDLANNQISDISPLVANSGLGNGDEIDLDNNWLDLSPDSQASQDVQTLRDRGAIVSSENQNPHILEITQDPTGTPNPVASGGQVECSLTAEDSLGHTLSYQWTALDSAENPAGSFDDATAQNPIWTAPANTSFDTAEFTISVTVTCSEGQEVSAGYTQQVLPEDAVRVTEGPSGGPNPVASGGQVQCSVTAEDSQGHDLSYQWSAEGGVGSFDDAAAQNPVWTAPDNTTAQVVEYEISVTVTCSEGEEATASYTQQVNPVPDEVTITEGPAGEANPAALGAEVQCSVTAEDSRGHTLSYQWSAEGGAGSFDDASQQNPTWTAPENTTDNIAEYEISVTVTCSEGEWATASYTQQVNPVADEVTITAGPSGDPNPVASGGQVQCTVEAEDSRGHDLTYQWSAEGDAGSFDDATNQNPTWTAPENTTDNVAEYEISVTVTCSQGQSAAASYTQQVNPVADEVTITAGPAGDPNPVAPGGQVQCGVTAEDSRGHSLSYQWSAEGGAGSFADATAQNATWTAPANTAGQVAEYEISVTVTCSEGASATARFTQQVEPAGAGDFDGDADVDIDDASIFIQAWIGAHQDPPQVDPSCDIAPYTGDVPDITSEPDDVIDIQDAQLFIQLWIYHHQ